MSRTDFQQRHLAMRALGIFFGYGENDGHAAVATFTAQPTEKATS
jgi:hypothetical protein